MLDWWYMEDFSWQYTRYLGWSESDCATVATKPGAEESNTHLAVYGTGRSATFLRTLNAAGGRADTADLATLAILHTVKRNLGSSHLEALQAAEAEEEEAWDMMLGLEAMEEAQAHNRQIGYSSLLPKSAGLDRSDLQ